MVKLQGQGVGLCVTSSWLWLGGEGNFFIPAMLELISLLSSLPAQPGMILSWDGITGCALGPGPHAPAGKCHRVLGYCSL